MLEGRIVFLFTEGLEEGWSYLVKYTGGGGGLER